MGVTYFLLCCLSLAITAQAQDCSRPVGGPNMVLKDKDILLETFPDGTQVTFACEVGYISAGGSAISICQGGSWTPVRLKCERKNCGPIGEVENGNVDYPEGTEFGDRAVITCHDGFILVGKDKIYCQDKGWANRLPVCEVVSCDPPPAVADGTFKPVSESYSYRDVVQYSCQKGYTLNGSISASCSDDGTFQPAPPSCIMVRCSDPQVDNAELTEGSQRVYGYMATVTFKCKTGFMMTGANSQRCEINSQWSPPLSCKLITCKLPPTVENGSFSPNKTSYNYGEAVQYSCQKNYTLSGAKSVTCSDNGIFTPGPPTCILITCKLPPTIENGSFSPNKASYNYGEAVQYSCQKGYTLSGAKSVTCSDNGIFTPGPPTCILITCKLPPTIENGSFSPNKAFYNYGEAVQYSCQKGYTLSGAKSVTCSDNGIFTPGPPTCIRSTTPPTTTTTTTTTEPPTGNGETVKVMLIVLAVIGTSGICLLCAFCIYKKKRGKRATPVAATLLRVK
uniref:Sushi domain-containing protein n=1 Tax=Dicentrarchus labrax TaxID=13489 RepID=A0A8P4FWJ7_DICLA